MLKFVRVGGATIRNGVSNLMNRLMPNAVMRRFNMTGSGSGSKEAFKITVVCGLVKGEYIYNIKKTSGNGLTTVKVTLFSWMMSAWAERKNMVLKNAIYTITVWATEPKTKLCVCTFGTVVKTNTTFRDLERLSYQTKQFLSVFRYIDVSRIQ